MRIKSSRGFSLLEIIIAMLVLSLVVAGLFGLFVTSHKFIGEAGHRLAAINYARRVAETLKVYVSAAANTPVNASNAFGNNNFNAIGLTNSVTLQGITYNLNYNVTPNPQGATGLREVSVRVNWREP